MAENEEIVQLGLNWDKGQKNGIIFNEETPWGAIFRGEHRRPKLSFEYDEFMYNEERGFSWKRLGNDRYNLTDEEIEEIREVATLWQQEDDEEGGLNWKNRKGTPSTAKFNLNTFGNLWVMEVTLENVGDMKQGHAHDFDHLHFLSHGKERVKIYNPDGSVFAVETHTAPAWLKVPKGYWHDIEALLPNTIGYCIQALHTADGFVRDTNYLEDITATGSLFVPENGAKNVQPI